MSLVRFALRLCAVRALKGVTLVGQNVRDSDIGAIDVGGDGSLRTDQDRPFVIVYTDDGTAEAADLRDLRQNGMTDLVLEFGIASPMTQTDPDTGVSTIVGMGVPDTDAGFEMTLDLVDRQIVAALTGPGPWAERWRGLSNSVTRIERRRAASSDNGVRIAARQLRIRLDALADPAWGQPLAATSPFAGFVAALVAAGDPLAGVAQAFLGPQDDAVTTETIRRSRGHTQTETQALGYGAAFPGSEAHTIDTVVLEEPGG